MDSTPGSKYLHACIGFTLWSAPWIRCAQRRVTWNRIARLDGKFKRFEVYGNVIQRVTDKHVAKKVKCTRKRRRTIDDTRLVRGSQFGLRPSLRKSHPQTWRKKVIFLEKKVITRSVKIAKSNDSLNYLLLKLRLKLSNNYR